MRVRAHARAHVQCMHPVGTHAYWRAHACVCMYGLLARACVHVVFVCRGGAGSGGSMPCVWEVCAPWRRGLFGPAAAQILPVSGHP